MILGCRSKAKGVATAKEICTLHPKALLQPLVLDLGSFKLICDAAKEFKIQHNEFDSHILNASIALTPYGLTEDGIEQQFGSSRVALFPHSNRSGLVHGRITLHRCGGIIHGPFRFLPRGLAHFAGSTE